MDKALRNDLLDYNASSNLEFNQKIKGLQRSGQNVYHFGFGESPFPPPDCFKKCVSENIDKTEYLPVAGLLKLREAIARLHKRWYNMDYDPSDIVVSPGSKELLFLILMVIDADVLIPMPSWSSYKAQCHLIGRQTYDIPSTYEDRYWFTAETLEQVAKQCSKKHKVLIINSPNNPTGLVLSAEQMKPICEVCRKNNILVISDEIYARLAFDGKFESIAKYYPEGTIVTSGFSKWSSAGGWTIGYALFPRNLSNIQHALTSAGSNTYTCASSHMQYGIAAALEHAEHLEKYVFQCRRILKAVSRFAHRSLTNAGCRAHQSEAAYYFMPDFEFLRSAFHKRDINDGQSMCDAILAEANVALLPCGPDFSRPAEEFTVRFCHVNFCGKAALDASWDIDSDEELDDDFVRTYCSHTFKGIEALLKWIEKQKESL